MESYHLRDLVLSGVMWEISEYPFSTAAAVAAATVSADVSRPRVQTLPPLAPGVSDIPTSSPMRTATSIVPPTRPVVPMSIDTAIAMAARPGEIGALLRMISEFNHPLRSAATNVVLPHIAENPSGLVIVTDVPGADDDASGSILGGAAGELLDKMLSAIGLGRDSVSIVPLVFWRTPGGRAPSRTELDLARPFVTRALEFLSPRLILTLGTLAASEVAGTELPRGHGVVAQSANGCPSMPIFHPNYLILKPTAKRDAWNALQNVQKLLKSPEE